VRVLIVTQYFWPEEFRVNDLAADLVLRGHEVVVLTGQPTYPSREPYPQHGALRPWTQRWRGVTVKRVPMLSRGRGQGWRLAGNFLSFAASASVLGPLRLRSRFDVVFVYEPSPITVTLPALVLKRLTGVPVVLWVQDLWPETLAATGAVRSPRLLTALSRMVRWLYAGCDRILVESKAFLPHAIATGADPAKLSYLPNWAESAYTAVEPPADGPERALVPAGFVVMFAGNLGTAQSLGTVLGAAQRLADVPEGGDVHWVLLGSGRAGDWLAREVAARGLCERVHLLGRWPVERMPGFFALADALLVTLQRAPIYALTVPSKVQSYLAAGRPVLGALDGEGAALVEAAGAGLAVPAEDADALAEAVLSLRAMPAEERADMGRRGRAYFREHFDRERLLAELEKILLETARV